MLQVARMVQKGEETGMHMILADKETCQDLIEILEDYCQRNKRKKKAKKILKVFESDLACY